MVGLTETPTGTWNLSYGKRHPTVAMQPLSDQDQGAWGEAIIEWFRLEEAFRDHLIHPAPALGRGVFD